ncbi:hypothetical protein GPX89_17080 [Nocardia sp. ET3-3]|uniref:Uncharacterized protein n=1 Tax=Nocardia terrae TaxID=2675851 RepID=A0A7K1UX44_9NOCA|nr:hypothetical protein [Nocardia terrae]MVU78953.1 hypothetical protein [Nocardia terrae]
MADDDFSGLRSDGRKGVYFDSGAAQTMAQQAADMLTVVQAAFALVQPEKDLPAFNQRASGAKLAERFNEATKSLSGTVAKDHVEVLTSMGEAFVAANKEYAQADQTSAVNFDQNVQAKFQGLQTNTGQPGLAVSGLAALTQHVDAVSLPGWGQSGRGNVYEWSGTSKDDYSNKLQTTEQASQLSALAHGAGIKLSGDEIVGEPGSQYGWDDFHNHWQYIHDSTILSDLAGHAQDWKTAAAYIKSQAATFAAAKDKYLKTYQGIEATGDTVWASDSAKQARDGIGHYLDNVKTLTDSMELMSANLAFAEGWLKKLQNFLPSKSIAQTTQLVAAGRAAVEMPISQSAVDEAMDEMRQAWDEWYGNGVKDSSKAVPEIPDPKAAVAVTPVKSDTPQQDGNTPQDTGTPKPTDSKKTETTQVDSPTQTTETKPTDTNTPTDTKTTDTTKTNTSTTTDSTLQSLISQAGTILQSGITAVEQGVEKVASAIQQGLQTTQTTTKTTEPTDQLTKQLQDMGLIPSGDSPTGGSPTTPTGVGSPETPKTEPAPYSATPATETEEETATVTRAGLATTSATSSGMTGGMPGTPGAGAQGQGKEYQRPEYLKGLDELSEALGEVPDAVIPVAET